MPESVTNVDFILQAIRDGDDKRTVEQLIEELPADERELLSIAYSIELCGFSRPKF